MKRIVLFIMTFSLLLPLIGTAQNTSDHPQRKRWFKEMQQLKRDYLTRELQLSDDQKASFFTEYDKMESEIENVRAQTRNLVKSVRDKGEKASDLELEKASEATFEVKEKEARIEKKYFQEFKKILKPKQLFRLKDVEMRFNRELLKHRSKSDPKHSRKSK